MKNKEVFSKDPTSFKIPNDGYTTIQIPKNQKEWDVLDFELRYFVCEGEYQHGLDLILSTFLANLDNSKQPAVWIAGFYGSGKSHLARVLEYLWKDLELPSGVSSRSLVELPNDISDLFIELSTAGKREGGLWAAAGTLRDSAGPSVKLAVLHIIFKAAGLPGEYPIAKFVIWLKQNGYYKNVKAYVENAGKDFDRELLSLYVSPFIAKALLSVYPDFANSDADARNLFREQYPKTDDVSNDELTRSIEDVLELQSDTPGKLPLTLLVFDELQQFIGEVSDRAGDLQEVVQVCTARFGSKLLFLATGQSALEADLNLQRLQDRFTVKIQLEDKDVERVIRNVVLRKRPDKVSILNDVLDKNKGEIDRHLVGTNIGAVDADNDVLVPDYPLLPTRRRFWEKSLRAIDIAGTAAQLRTQLRVTHEAVSDVADKELGTVVSADVIYWQQEPSMLQSGLLGRELATMISQLNDGTPKGKLRSRLCATIFLIGNFPTTGPDIAGVKATADTLADLLIENLSKDSAGLRKQIPILLQDLVEDGKLMLIENGEYRLQTREGSDWEAGFNRRFAQIRDNVTRIDSERSELFRKAVEQATKKVSLVHGRSKTPRKINLYFGLDTPQKNTEHVPIWIRDEWNASDKTVREDAQAGGTDDPTIYVLLPRLDADEFKISLARYLAASETVDTRHKPTTQEGMLALQAMKAKRDIALGKLTTLIEKIVNNARVYQGGGNLVAFDKLQEGITVAAESSLARMFPGFDIADHGSWDKVVKRAIDGNPDPLSTLGYNGEIDKHPVCKEVRAFIGSSGKKGADIRKKFTGYEFGWPRDAVDGAIISLVSGGFLRVAQNSQEKSLKEVTPSQLARMDFYSEGFTVSVTQKIAVRKLLTEFKISYKKNEEMEKIPELFAYLFSLAKEAGGDAPLPAQPDVNRLYELQELAGNERVVALAEAQQELLSFHSDWQISKALIKRRQPRWVLLTRLCQHAAALPLSGAIESQVDAIKENRSLLNDPNPIKPLIDQAAETLREALSDAQGRLQDVYKEEMANLKKSKVWIALDAIQQETLIQQFGLEKPTLVTTKTEDALLSELDSQPLSTWENQIEALTGRFEKARTEAARILEPEIVQVAPKTATIKTRDDLDKYVADLRKEIEQILDQGNPVVITRRKTD